MNMKKIIVVMVISVFLSLTGTVSAEWSENWEFEYGEETAIVPQYETQDFSVYTTLDFSAKAHTTAQTQFTLYDTLTFGAKTEVQGQDAIVFTRVLQNPSNIRMNDTTSNTNLYITYNLTTNNTDINETSVFLAMVMNETTNGCLNTTYKLPASPAHPDKMEAVNRECVSTGYWWESLFNDTGTISNELGYCSEWSVRNESLSGNFKINSHGSNWTNFSFNPKMYRIPSTIQMVDYYNRVHENKSTQLLDVFLGNLVKTNFNMTDTCFYDVPYYNNTLYTFFYNVEQIGNPASGLQIYFANKSYDADPKKPELSSNCELIKEIQFNDPATYSAGNSSYHNATFSTDVDGKVGSVQMTSDFSIIFRKKTGNNGKKFQVVFADDNISHGDHYHNFNQSETTQISTTFGNSWTYRNGTIDCYFNFVSLNDEDQLMYKVYAQTEYDTTGNGNWSSVQTDLIDESNYAPNNPNVLSQSINGTYPINSVINFTYSWLGDPNFDTCWVNLTVHNETHDTIAWVQNRTITSAEYAINNTWWYNWDSTGLLVTNQKYHLNITATDPYGLSSHGTSNGTFDVTYGAVVTANGSQNTEETNSTLFGYLIDNQSEDTTCWFQWNKEVNDFSSPTGNQSVGVQAQGTNFSYNATPLENGTFYYFRTRANNSNGFNASSNECYFLTKPQPATGLSATSIGGGFRINWTHGDGHNISFLIVNTTHYPQSRTDGDNIYYGTNNYYDHTGLVNDTTYYYRVWERADWSNPVETQYSDGNISINTTYTYTASFETYTTLFFGSKADIQGDDPVLSNEQPTNASINNDMYPLLQITVNEPQDQNFNISWSTNATGTWVYYNSTCTDGTFSQRATFANASNTTYWWTVKVNDIQPGAGSDHWTNETYHFTTATYSWGDWSTWWTFTYTCEAPADFEASTVNFHTINLSWALNETTDKAIIIRNESGYAGYPINQTNGTVIYNNTGTYYEDIGLNQSTTYYYTIWGWNNTESEYSVINQTVFNTTQAINPPSSFSASTFNETQINLTWTKGSQADKTRIVRNASGYPHYPSSLTNGTLIYNDTGTNYEDTGLIVATIYYYSAWSWNNSESAHSLTYSTDSGGTTGALEVCCEYPVNLSTELSRPPVNISVQINGTGLDVYFYWYNMTPMTDAWELVTNWSGQDTNRFNYTTLWTNGWVWGNTVYHWRVNVTDGVTWTNNSYQYNTTQLANGADARYDVSNDDWVDGSDLLNDYAHRTGETTYDGIYDVNTDDWVDGTDLLLIYANRS